jgi:hypothetical protein
MARGACWTMREDISENQRGIDFQAACVNSDIAKVHLTLAAGRAWLWACHVTVEPADMAK